MMTAHTAFVLSIFAKACVSIAAIAGAVYLAGKGRDGLGWLLLVAVLAAPGPITTSDDEPKVEVKK